MSDELKNELQTQIQYALVEQLSSTRLRQDKLLELLDECVFECTNDLRLRYVNAAWQRHLGYKPELVHGNHLFKYIKKDVYQNIILSYVIEVSKDKPSDGVEVQLVDSKESNVWFELRLVKNADDGYIGSLYEIHKRKSIEAKLRAQEAKFRRLSLVASHTNNLVIITNQKGCIEWVNPGFEKRTGFLLEEVVGEKPGDLLQGPDTSGNAVAEMSAAIAVNQPFKVEVLNYDKMKNPYWVAIDAMPVVDDNGELIQFIAVETEITRRVEIEQALSESEYNYRSVVDNISEAVIKIDVKGNIIFANNSWMSILKLSEKEYLGLPFKLFVTSSYQDEVVKIIDDSISGKWDNRAVDLRMISSSNHHIWVEMRVVPIISSAGVVTSVVVTLVDINDRVEAAHALEEARMHAEALANAKTRFMANISHEIRTPLNAVLGAADILRGTGLTIEQDRYADMIKTSGDALLSILDDVLIHSRFESGVMQLENEQFELINCFEEAVDIITDSALDKGLEIVLDVYPEIPVTAKGDKVRLRQILINLLANAVKFTNHGSIIIEAKKSEDINDIFSLEISVKDTGIGIAEDKIHEMFEPFIQSDVSTTRKYGGSGLGLAICKQICETAGGSIDVSSVLGRGSTFTVKYPLYKDNHNKRAFLRRNLTEKEQNSKICVVGNNHYVNTAVKHLMERYKVSASWFEVVEELSNQKGCFDYDYLIVTDTSQVEGCRKFISPYLRVGKKPCQVSFNLKGKDKRINIIGSSEISIPGPFKTSHVVRGIETLEEILVDLKPTFQSTFLQKISTSNVKKYLGLKVLVVEDNEHNRVIATQYLEQQGALVFIAEHGVSAISILEKETVDIILMDIQMPVMDGITATTHIRRSSKRYSTIPIIAVTADAIYGDRERFLKAGMNDYLPKPLFKDKLYEIIDKNLSSTSPQENISKAQKILNMSKLINH